MKTFVLAVLAILAAATASFAEDAVGGKWQIHQSIVGNESDLACTFTQNGEEVAGTCASTAGELKLTGKISQNKISWIIKSEYNGTPLTMKYSGTLASATKMTGTVSVDPYGAEGEFTATQAK
jgi:hypothetical protein